MLGSQSFGLRLQPDNRLRIEVPDEEPENPKRAYLELQEVEMQEADERRWMGSLVSTRWVSQLNELVETGRAPIDISLSKNGRRMRLTDAAEGFIAHRTPT